MLTLCFFADVMWQSDTKSSILLIVELIVFFVGP